MEQLCVRQQEALCDQEQRRRRRRGRMGFLFGATPQRERERTGAVNDLSDRFSLFTFPSLSRCVGLFVSDQT
ncbi:unnamed protein product [Pleuronectes platessa]|uniref:Uncharacterized protein n=1 Tax=Pleuronectes platessa TaxID=8262 RepID=A0A9N7YCR9_PLEPL|nr:unnamed protein product [Pleuronectes platessa]